MEKGVAWPQPRHASRRLFAPAVALAASLLVPGLLCAQEAGALPLRPGETLPHPRQRNLSEILDMPTHVATCPACDYAIEVIDRDKLMRKPAGATASPPWRMDESSRDADLCPHPMAGKISYQADIVICPSCGYSAPESLYGAPLQPKAREWVADTFRNELLAAQKTMLGKRADEMTDAEIVAFFNRQSEIPDTIRTEHNRIRTLARKDAALIRAEATWLAAWAARRAAGAELAGDFLAKRGEAARTALAAAKRSQLGLPGEVEAVRHLLGKTRAGKDRLNAGERVAARVMLAGFNMRLGFTDEAERELGDLHRFLRDRFQHPEQDPLWPLTSAKLSKERRRSELNDIRAECEAEVGTRLELVRREREYLRSAADLIREAILGGELDSRPEEAMFHAYLAGEFLRRAGNLPLAAEWFKLILSIAPEGAPVETAAQLQLAQIREQAGDKINLLSAIGEDAEAFERIREILRAAAP